MKSRAAIHIKTNQQLLIDDIDIPDPKADYVNLKMFSKNSICIRHLRFLLNILSLFIKILWLYLLRKLIIEN